MAASLVFVVPGSLETPTGGYVYDKRMVEGLRARGWGVSVRELADEFPFPSAAAVEDAARTLAAIPDDRLVVVDGLAFGALPDVAAREAARLRLVALVHHPLGRETGLDPLVAARLDAGERRALASARHVVVTSRATARALDEYGVSPHRISTVEPGTEAAPLARGSHDGIVHLLTVATLTPRKGHETLINALQALDGHAANARTMPPDGATAPPAAREHTSLSARTWHLTCVGSLTRDSAAADRVRRAIVAAGLSDRVTLVGDVPTSDVSRYYDAADIFVLPTMYEGYGMVVAEALARGLPVISTPTGAIADLVGRDAGLLVPPGDVAALARALGAAIRDRSLRTRLAEGARHVRSRLDTPEVAAARLDAVLGKVVRA